MQAVEITYERTFNLGNYESMKLGMKLALSEGDSEAEAMEKAEAFILNKAGVKNDNANGAVAGGVGENKTSKKAAKPSETKTTKKKTTKKADKKPEETYTQEDVQAKLKEVAQAKGSRDVPMTILKEQGGAEALSKVDSTKYPAIMKELEKCLKK